MAIEKLHLQETNRDKDYNNLIIGKSRFTDDIWDLSDLIYTKTTSNAFKKINFSYIQNEKLKYIAKVYAYQKLGTIKPQTVVTKITCDLRLFVKYADINKIGSFADIDKDVFLNFNGWLKNEYIIENGRNKGKKIVNRTGYRAAFVVEEIIKIGQKKNWEVPKTNIFADISSSDLWLNNEKTKDERVLNKTKPIPEDIFDKILYYAVNKERTILTKAGIIIQSQTGLRISEVLSIQEGCLKTTSDGYHYMQVWISKTEKAAPVLHEIFVNELVKNIVEELEKHTFLLRKESKLKELFLYKREGKIIVIKPGNFNRLRLKNFIKRWEIRDNKGNLYHLHSHQFRATYVRELIKQKVPLAYIMKHFNHISIEMTAHYLTLQKEEIKEIYSDFILDPESKIAGLRSKEIKDKLKLQFRGKTEQEINNITKELAQSMSFNPLPTGVCLYDFRRGNCSDGDGCFFYNCPNYITEIRFYPILKKELDLMGKEMSRFKELGRERDWQRQYVKWKYLKPLVDSLEAQMNGQEKAE